MDSKNESKFRTPFSYKIVIFYRNGWLNQTIFYTFYLYLYTKKISSIVSIFIYKKNFFVSIFIYKKDFFQL